MEEMKPQMTQMDADSGIQKILCANLRNLRLNHSLARAMDKTLRKVLEEIGV
ncbi:hypothetical protein SAMN05660653_00353 [Desulfonatronum thiosulfatophilum]|uniref:Uncharacterized protein n=2 Tax=Desulfonatronum thiosulfatophilum TaxID=617002 RepID=A0A1G6AHU5_9BACT|nr:hypothetical protein SAMN05660653_00353 [Desulfonatronum thiosulfatophilum]